MHLKRGTVGEGEKGMGRKGGSVYSQPGIRADRNSCHDTEEGFQVSKGRVPRNNFMDPPVCANSLFITGTEPTWFWIKEQTR
jgi:hypothetical protein